MNVYFSNQNGMNDIKIEENKDHIISVEYLSEVLSNVKGELEEIDREQNIQEFIVMLKTFQDEFLQKFEKNPQIYNKFRNMFDIHFESILKYHVRSLSFPLSKKNSIIEYLSNEFHRIIEEYQNFQQNITSSVNIPKSSLLNEEKLISLINSLSTNIKDHFSKNKKGLDNVKTSTESMVDQLLFSKSSLSDVFVHMSTSPSNQMFKDKEVKDKINNTLEKLDYLNDLRNNILKSIKYLEQSSAKFYDDAKSIFKNLKNLHINQTKLTTSMNRMSKSNGFSSLAGTTRSNSTQRMDNKIPRANSSSQRNLFDEKANLIAKVNALKKQNEEILIELNSIKHQYTNICKENSQLKIEVEMKNKNLNDIKTTSANAPNLLKTHSLFSSNLSNVDISKEGLAEKRSVSTRDQNTFSERLKVNTQLLKHNEQSTDDHKIYVGNNQSNLITKNFQKIIEMILNFLQQMSNLQKSITNKSTNVKELKMDFERKKKELIEFANTCNKTIKSESTINSNDDHSNIYNDSIQKEVVIQEKEILKEAGSGGKAEEPKEGGPADQLKSDNLPISSTPDKPMKPLNKQLSTFPTIVITQQPQSINNDQLQSEITVLNNKVNCLILEKDKLIEEINKYKQTNSEHKEVTKDLIIEKETLIKEIESYNKNRGEHERIIIDLKNKKEENEKALSELKGKIVENKRSMFDLNDKLEQIRKENEIYLKKNNDLNTNVANLKNEISRLNDDVINKIQKENLDLKGEISKLTKNLTSLDEKNEMFLKEKEMFSKKSKELEDENLLLKNSIGELERGKKSAEKTRKSLENEFERMKGQISGFDDSAKEKEERVKNLETSIKNLTSELNQCKNSLEKEINEKNDMTKKYEIINKTLNSLKLVNEESNNLNLQINISNNELKQNNQELQEKVLITQEKAQKYEIALNNLSAEHQKLEDLYNLICEELSSMEKEQQQNNENVKNMNHEIAMGNQRIKEINKDVLKKEEEISNLNGRIKDLTNNNDILQSKITENNINIENKSNEYKVQIDSLNLKIFELEEGLIAREDENSNLKKELEMKFNMLSEKNKLEINLKDNLKESEKKYNKLDEEYKEMIENNNLSEEKIIKLQNIIREIEEKYSSEKENKEKIIKEYDYEIKNLNEKLFFSDNSSKEKINELQSSVMNLSGHIEKLKSDLDKQLTINKEFNLHNIDLSKKINELSTLTEKLKHDILCSNNDLDLANKSIEKLTTENKNLRQNLTENGIYKINLENQKIILLNGKISDLEKVLSDEQEKHKEILTVKLKKIDVLTNDLNAKTKQNDELIEEISNSNESIKLLTAKNNEMVNEINKLNDLKSQHESNITKLKEESTLIRHSLENSNYDNSCLNKKIEKALTDLSETEAKLKLLNEANESLVQKSIRLQKNLEESNKNNIQHELRYEELKMLCDKTSREKEDKIKGINSTIDQINKDKQNLQVNINNLENKLKEQKENYESEINKTTEEMNKALKEIDKINGIINDKTIIIKQFVEEVESLNRVNTQLKESLNSNSNQVGENKKEAEFYKIKLLELNDKITKIKEKKRNYKRENINKNENIETLTKINETISSEINILKHKIQDLVAENSKYNELLINYNSLQGKLVELDNKIPHLKEKKKHYKNLYNQLKDSLEKSDLLIEDITNERNKLNDVVKELNKKDSEKSVQILNLEGKLRISKEKKMKLKEETKKQKEQIDKLIKEYKEMEKSNLALVKDFENLKKTYSELFSNFNTVSVKLRETEENLKDNETKYNKLETTNLLQYKELESKYNEQEQLVLIKNKEIEKLEKDNENLKGKDENPYKLVNTYDPEMYKIISEKKLNKIGLNYYLMSKKDEESNVTKFDNLIWVESNKIDENAYEREYDSSFDKEKEILNLRQINDNLVEKLSKVTYNPNTDNFPSIPLEKYEKLIHQLNEEQMNYQNLVQALEVVKKENEFYKQVIDKKDAKNSGNAANLSFINQENNMESKFIENVDEINDLFLDSGQVNNINNNLNLEVVKIDSNNYSSNNPHPNSNNLLGIRKNSGIQEKKSIQSLKTRRTDESIKEQKEFIKENIKDNIHKMEENEKLFNEQLQNLKEELKETRNKCNNFKKLYEQCLTMKDDKSQIVILLKQAFEKLIMEITLTTKIKEILTVIMKLIDYNEEQINDIFNKKEKKKNFFSGIFGK